MQRATRILAGLVLLIRLTGTANGEEAAPPYPRSPVIAGFDWAPLDTIVRGAHDGDNWPMTWADDDALYTTYGDGTGFPPKSKRKLSCGFARIDGGPDGFVGANVPSNGEQLGDGPRGDKGRGLLSVGGVLYLWLDCADDRGGGSRLGWSIDHARTWTFADWRLDDFGLVGFVNFGRDYQGARDDFVYAYSHDGRTSRTPADRFILMRSPRNRLTRKDAWEYYAGTVDGRPTWSSDPGRREGVFTNPDACLRSAMTYHPGLRRYLWWQQIPQPKGHADRADTRFEGGFGVYDAPEPWGPWTTAYFTPRWDTGPGEHGDFPTKWADADGKTLYLVFSGEDAFSVRRVVVRLVEGAE